MSVTVTCPKCQSKLKIAEAAVGKSVKCPNCSQVFRSQATTKPTPNAAEAPRPRKPAAALEIDDDPAPTKPKAKRPAAQTDKEDASPSKGKAAKPKKKSGCGTVLLILSGIGVLLLVAVLGVGWWAWKGLNDAASQLQVRIGTEPFKGLPGVTSHDTAPGTPGTTPRDTAPGTPGTTSRDTSPPPRNTGRDTAPEKPPTGGGLPAGWVEFTSPDGVVKIVMPAKPKTTDLSDGDFKYEWEGPDEVSFVNLTVEKLPTEAEAKARCEEEIKSDLDGPKPLKDETVTINGVKVRELQFLVKEDNNIVKHRFFYVKNRVYSVGVRAEKSAYVTKGFDKVFDLMTIKPK